MNSLLPYRDRSLTAKGNGGVKAAWKQTAFVLFFGLLSCRKEKAEPPEILDVNVYMQSSGNKDSAVTAGVAKLPLTIMVKTDADMCTVWPAGERVTVKSVVDPTQDSLDVYHHPVLVRSDDYRDYGLTGARGKLMTGNKDIGYSLTYTYNNPGTYEIAIVAAKNGNASAGYSNTVVKKVFVVK